jgi:ADP-ribose pyrophosphatase YjhB (NUDIX family)
MKYAVQAVILNDKGEVLAVSRKDNHDDFGLVGGKVDPEDHTPTFAMLREVKEETGLTINRDTMEIVFQMHKDGYMGITYLVKDWEGEIQTDEPHVVKWTTFNEIMRGSFGKWNNMVRESLNSMGIEFLVRPKIEKVYYFHISNNGETHIAITSKEYWEKEGCLADHYPDTAWDDIMGLAIEGGFLLSELAESQFKLIIKRKEVTDIDTILALMLNAGFQQNKDFSNYLD